MPEYAVRTDFTVRDRVSPAFKRMGKNADRFGRRTSSAFRNASKEGFRFNTILKGILAANLIRGGVAQVTRGLGEAIREFVRFDDVMVGATARFQEVKVGTKGFGVEVDRLKGKIRQLAVGTRFTTTEGADTLNTLAKANLGSATALGIMRKQMDLATATQTDLNEATGITVDLLSGMYGISQNANTNIKNMAELTDSLTAGTLGANVTLTDLYETLKGLGPIARAYGTSAQEIITLSAVIGGAGLKGTRGETALKNIMLRLGDKKIAANLRANGVAIEDLAGNMLSPVAIIDNISKKLEGMGTATTIPILTELFGLRGFAGADIIARNLDNIQRLFAKIRASKGVSKALADEMEKSLGNRFLKLGSAALELGFRILEAFQGRGKKGIDSLVEAINKFNVKPIIDSINLLITTVSALWAVFKPFAPFLPEIVGGFIALNIATKLIALGPLIIGFFRLITSVRLMAITMWALNTAMLANPILWIPAAVAAAVVAIIFLERKFKIFSKTLEVIKNIFLAMWRAAKALFGIKLPGLSEFGAGVTATEDGGERTAPNARDASAKNFFQGQLDITGAPAGSTVSTSGNAAPAFEVNLLGEAP